MANPVLSDDQLKAISQRGTWAAPDPSTLNQPAPDTMSPWDSTASRQTGQRMTMGGVVTATGTLLALLIASSVVGWNLVEDPRTSSGSFPTGIILISFLVGLGCVFFAMRKPHLARILGPIYALAEGLLVGAISHAYEIRFDGLVMQAVGCTIAVFLVMLALHSFRILRVTDRMRRMVMGATLGLMVFYLASWVIGMFTDGPSFHQGNGIVGIGFSVIVVALAALNLSLDFDTIERSIAARSPKGMEWVCALGLLVTIVWLYLELLRLLSKLQRD